MGTRTKGLDLFFNAGSAINGADLDTLVPAKAEEFFLALNGQFPRWSDDEGLYVVISCINFI